MALPAPMPNGIYSLRFYQAGTLTPDFDDNQWVFTMPDDNTKQAWSKAIRIVSETGGYVEFSFDGVDVHGRVDDGAIAVYLNRYEGGIAVRGSGDFIVEAW